MGPTVNGCYRIRIRIKSKTLYGIRVSMIKQKKKFFLQLTIRDIYNFFDIKKYHLKNRGGAMEIGINADEGINESYKGAKSASA